MDKINAKLELFRQAVQQQADEEIAAAIAEINSRREAADKAQTEIETKAALENIKAETTRINAQYKRELSKCDYDTKKAVLRHRSELIEEFFRDTEEKLRQYAASEKYSGYLKRSLDKIRASIALDNSAVIYAREQDIPAVREFTSCEIVADNTIRLGGLRAMCRTKNVFCDATLDMALEDEKKLFTEKTELRL